MNEVNLQYAGPRVGTEGCGSTTLGETGCTTEPFYQHGELDIGRPQPYFTNGWIQSHCVGNPYTVEAPDIPEHNELCHTTSVYLARCPEGQKHHLSYMLNHVGPRFLDALRSALCKAVRWPDRCSSIAGRDFAISEQLANVTSELSMLRERENCDTKDLEASIASVLQTVQEAELHKFFERLLEDVKHSLVSSPTIAKCILASCTFMEKFMEPFEGCEAMARQLTNISEYQTVSYPIL
ncbi:hypothetical protein BDV97DRAFT_422748 [Delphinella strobiligena]|nr:hypothetical protein BDV97DRAFT_422748 [Delphinella strobiligena]